MKMVRELPYNHPAPKFSAAHYCFSIFVLEADMDEYYCGVTVLVDALRNWEILVQEP